MRKDRFEELADNAAAGLRNDPELFLDVKQELQSHLEDKAEQFAQEGHAPEESRELAGKSFGSPMDIAAELLAANKRRMRFRALMRLALGILIVPVAVLLALYSGYGRLARMQDLSVTLTGLAGGSVPGPRLPDLPFSGKSSNNPAFSSVVRELTGNHKNLPNLLRYWERHRDEKDSHVYYAYYAGFLDPKLDANYVDAMRLGERIEPKNALYNLNLATYYLERGIKARAEKDAAAGDTTDTLLDRRAFEAGIAELRKATEKPYLRTYQTAIVRKKLNSLPQPVLAEEYVTQIAICSAELFPQFIQARHLARKISGCARILHSEGRDAEAEAVMDTWKPYTQFLASEPDTLIHMLVAQAVGKILSKEGIAVYQQLGAREKAGECRRFYQRLNIISDEWKSSQRRNKQAGDQYRQHASVLTRILLPALGGTTTPTERELTPSRMQEHVFMEQAAVHAMLAVLLLALIGAVVQAAAWLFRLRRAGSVPILLLPPPKVIAKAILLGVALPVVAYWIYSQMPVIGGREFGVWSYMWPRFIVELVALTLIVLWLPSYILRKYIVRRCGELDIPVPEPRAEVSTNRRVRAAIFVGLLLYAIVPLALEETSPIVSTAAAVLSIAVIVGALGYAGGIRRDYGLYYGTVARSLMPVYALSIILLSLTAKPWLTYNEAMWLRKDTLMYGALLDRRSETVGFTGLETRASRELSDKLLKALGDGRR